MTLDEISKAKTGDVLCFEARFLRMGMNHGQVIATMGHGLSRCSFELPYEYVVSFSPSPAPPYTPCEGDRVVCTRGFSSRSGMGNEETGTVKAVVNSGKEAAVVVDAVGDGGERIAVLSSDEYGVFGLRLADPL